MGLKCGTFPQVTPGEGIAGPPVHMIAFQASHSSRSASRIFASAELAGQKLGIKEVDEGIWLASFMHYDLGYFDLEQKTLQPLDNPFGTRLSPIS